MHYTVDKKGILFSAKLFLLLFVIFTSFGFGSRELEHFLTPGTDFENPITSTPQEESFFLNTSSEKPVFMSKKDVLKKRDAFTWEQKDFIFADLHNMRLTRFEKGVERSSYPILAKAGQNSFFEIPSGLYAVQAKSENPLSKLENVHLPWTLYLFGNYIIHAWPRLPNGRPMPPTSNGGGIRLSEEDAKSLFNDTSAQTPVLIYNNEEKRNPQFGYFRRTNLPFRVPQTIGASAIAADLETGGILFEKNQDDAYPLASVSKLVTATVALEHLDANQLLEVDKDAIDTYGNSAGFIKGETFKAGDMLHALILPSSNDAAKVYERAIPNFIALMNKKAKELQTQKMYFADSSGLSQENVASAADLFKTLRYISEKQPKILEVSREKEYRATATNKKITHIWRNINWPPGDPRFLGGKAGFIQESLQTMAGMYAIHSSEYGARPVIIIVLGSRDRIGDTRAIISYLEHEFIYGAKTPSANTPNDHPQVSIIDK